MTLAAFDPYNYLNAFFIPIRSCPVDWPLLPSAVTCMKSVLSLVVLALLLFLTAPYYQLVRLDRALARDDQDTLEQILDLPAMQEQIRRRINKDSNSRVGEVSNRFVEWLQDGIQRLGGNAVEQLVTTDWVREQLLAKVPAGQSSFLSQVSQAFFDAPDRFLVRIGTPGQDPVQLRLSLQAGGWRVTTFYN